MIFMPSNVVKEDDKWSVRVSKRIVRAGFMGVDELRNATYTGFDIFINNEEDMLLKCLGQ